MRAPSFRLLVLLLGIGVLLGVSACGGFALTGSSGRQGTTTPARTSASSRTASTATATPTSGASTSPASTAGASTSASASSPAADSGVAASIQARSIRRIVALGDSVTSGYNCGCDGYPWMLATLVSDANGHSVAVDNLGANGQTASGLAQALASDATTRRDVSAADVVLVTIGANDLSSLLDQEENGGCGTSCITPVLDQDMADIATTLSRIHALAPDATVLVTDYWNVFADGDAVSDSSQLAWSDALTRRFNAGLKKVVAAAGMEYVDLYAPFKGSDGGNNPTNLLASDGDHPNAAGHRLIAKTLAAQLGIS